MSDIYKLQYSGMTLAYPGCNGYMSFESAPAYKTLTLCAAEGGTLTADSITGMPGDTVQLSTAYNTYWRFSGYAKAGDGTLSNNTYTFGEDDEQIVSAYFKKNAFTATGGWEKGSNVTASKPKGSQTYVYTANVPAKYAVHGAHTGDVPAAWYNSSNRWKVTTTPSAYAIKLNPKMSFGVSIRSSTADQCKTTAVTLIGSTSTQQQTYQKTGGSTTWNYNKTLTSNTTGVLYGCSAHLYASAWGVNWSATNWYIATATTGTWSATGYAP